MKQTDNGYAGLSGLIERMFLETARIVTAQVSLVEPPPRIFIYDDHQTILQEGITPAPPAGNGQQQHENPSAIPGENIMQAVIVFTQDGNPLHEEPYPEKTKT